MKQCRTCKIEKEYLLFSKNKSAKDGYQSDCKDCCKTYVINNKIRLKEYRDNYRITNKDVIRSVSKEWRTENSKILRDRKRQFYLENKEKIKEYKRNYNIKNRATLSKKKAKYYKENRGVVNAKNSKHRAVKRKATPKWLTVEHYEQIRNIYVLADLMKKQNNINYDVDHVIPLISDKVCGLHVPWNLQILEASINRSKGNKLIGE